MTRKLYTLLLTLVLLLGLTATASADVIAGPMIAIYVGVKFILPLLLVALVVVVTVHLIRSFKKHRRNDHSAEE